MNKAEFPNSVPVIVNMNANEDGSQQVAVLLRSRLLGRFLVRELNIKTTKVVQFERAKVPFKM